MKIGDIATATGLSVETIRYYEKIGLLPPPARSENGYRHYRPLHLERLQFIKRCRSLDMAQDEIRQLIDLARQPDADCRDVDALLARHLQHVRERLQELASLEQTLVQLQSACSQGKTVRECGILDGLNAHQDTTSSTEAHNHVPGTHGKGHA
ncbi:Cd(II)/Pb(II)-responsive transcriptional regulator [Marinobacterium sp. 3-1745]|uniref:Cd(II)/Pb(II)-responsive transcriptional regulator n=2 Tax=Marinobacterium marinum TaxID=2756129 RepID=A0A7W1X0M0_9GAMM|nr:Cd(II)/Pb(II)-responsive transcriptional regulator [Marinobacterium marinum]